MNGFSPRMRGCFSSRTCTESPLHLFPAHAGVFPPLALPQPLADPFPRACGGVSKMIGYLTQPNHFSPRMRGCFRGEPPSTVAIWLFPAHAGVFLGFNEGPPDLTVCITRICRMLLPIEEYSVWSQVGSCVQSQLSVLALSSIMSAPVSYERSVKGSRGQGSFTIYRP